MYRWYQGCDMDVVLHMCQQTPVSLVALSKLLNDGWRVAAVAQSHLSALLSSSASQFGVEKLHMHIYKKHKQQRCVEKWYSLKVKWWRTVQHMLFAIK